jgi:2-dehydro-3-deoxygalactonokinase
MRAAFIALDWGTTSFRAYRAAANGSVLDTVTAPQGILAVTDGAFDEAMEAAIGSWDVALPVICAGMITSRQGWHEVPYVPCPAGLNEIASGCANQRSRRGRNIHFVPGLSYMSGDGIPDVMRGEETQVLGASRGGSETFVTPGTHSKWIDVEDGIIHSFATYMTGEAYAVMRNHSILGKLMQGDAADEAAFLRGAKLGLDRPGGLLHTLFSVRTLGLFDQLRMDSLPSYLSGILIGSEIGHAIAAGRKPSQETAVLGAAVLGSRYVAAMKVAGISAQAAAPTVAVQGLARIADALGLFA